MAAKKKAEVVEITTPSSETNTFMVVGTTALLYNAMSLKVQGGLLSPPAPKSRAERATTAKHNPMREYRDSVYYDSRDDAPTYLNLPAVCFKRSLASTALDMPGATKAALERLIWAEGERVAIYGIPKMYMAVVRNSDPARTPDIRTRAIVQEWAAEVTFSWVLAGGLNRHAITNLFAAAGMMRGVGDGRPQKGALTFGRWRIVNEGDKDFARIKKAGGRKAQLKAVETPEYHDEETERLYEFFVAETKRRELKVI